MPVDRAVPKKAVPFPSIHEMGVTPSPSGATPPTEGAGNSVKRSKFMDGVLPEDRVHVGDIVPGTFSAARSEMKPVSDAQRRSVQTSAFAKQILHGVNQSCAQKRAVNHKKAVETVAKYCSPDSDPEKVLADVVEALRNAPLTSSFNMRHLDLNSIQTGDGTVQNCFAPGQKRWDSGYLKHRDAVEEKLFGLPAHYRNSPYGGMAQRAIRKYFFFSSANPDFDHRTRPVYAALSPFQTLATGVYGKSVAVFDPSALRQSTFFPRDTFSEPDPEALCDYTHIENLLAYGEHSECPTFVKTLIEGVETGSFQPSAEDHMNYIDTQIHGPVSLLMLTEVRLSRAEIEARFSEQERSSFLRELEQANRTLGRTLFSVR